MIRTNGRRFAAPGILCRAAAVLLFMILLCAAAGGACAEGAGPEGTPETAAAVPPQSIQILTKSGTELPCGKSLQLRYELTPEGAPATDVTWTTSNPDVIRVDRKGVVTAVSAGTAAVTGTLPNRRSWKVTLTVPTLSPGGDTFLVTGSDCVYRFTYCGTNFDRNVTVTAGGNCFDYTLSREGSEVSVAFTPLRTGTGTLNVRDANTQFTVRIRVTGEAFLSGKLLTIGNAVYNKREGILAVTWTNTGADAVTGAEFRVIPRDAEGNALAAGTGKKEEMLLEKRVFQTADARASGGVTTSVFTLGDTYPDAASVDVAFDRIIRTREEEGGDRPELAVLELPDDRLCWFSTLTNRYTGDPENAAPYTPPDTKELETAGRGRFGFTAAAVPGELAELYGYRHSGLLILSVEAGSPAEAGGLEAGDLVFSVNGIEYRSEPYFAALGAAAFAKGKPAVFGIERDGKVLTKELTEAIPPAAQAEPAGEAAAETVSGDETAEEAAAGPETAAEAQPGRAAAAGALRRVEITETELPEAAAPGSSRPSASSLPAVPLDGQVREAFFANGTPVVIREPGTDTDGWVHDEEVQKQLGNHYSPSRKPGTGAVVSWQEGEETRYAYISEYCKVFGGSLNRDVQADVRITVKGSDVRGAFPNIAYLFGGGCGGDVVGSVTVELEESQVMHVYGGGCNGSVTGNTEIRSAGCNWFRTVTGGGLASSHAGEAAADVGGDVILDLRGSMLSRMESLVGGGIAETVSGFAARADVFGSISLYAEGRNVSLVLGGGKASRVKDSFGEAEARVMGGVSAELENCRILAGKNNRTALKGGLVAGGYGHLACASVGGDILAVVSDTVFDNDTAGIILGGMADGGTAEADVGGNACGRILAGSNPPAVHKGGLSENGGKAVLRGETTWYYSLRDGILEY